MKIAILGLGTVGKGVLDVLVNNQKIITARAGEQIIPVAALVRDLAKAKEAIKAYDLANFTLSTNADEILMRDDIDVFVELIGGVDLPRELISTLLKRKKPVVTANKALLAYHRSELEMLAKDTPFGFEASVAGGIPIIKALREGLSANHIEQITGILNGTSNYILTNMMKDGLAFKDALLSAQKLGYAEADPSFDIGGFDAAHKLLILASIAYKLNAKPDDILIEGIENISSDDIYFAQEFGYAIKLLAIAKKSAQSLELRVHPALLEHSKMIAKVDGVMNAVSVWGDCVGESMYYGAGAGAKPTASAVISDLIDIARKIKSPMLGYKDTSLQSGLSLVKSDDLMSKFYLRLRVHDELGVIAKITNIMSQNELSIDSFLQKPNSSKADTTVYFTTHTCKQANVLKSLELIGRENFVVSKPFMIRIEK
ncbi:homoserine dehydrogenase [Candidatus Campylobacter infans]|uniref:Homoserine dehydrogenase n=1 Tax=Candidatus Campylobacter infans TaxID=2561898 RepID=A0A7H9CKX7_9BACT|nr:homoserine dehydrogenase [Candidatus Campylobacter infans]QLI05955.1 homoserine dehydrogenase [Candidatus Campylobacter infans]